MGDLFGDNSLFVNHFLIFGVHPYERRQMESQLDRAGACLDCNLTSSAKVAVVGECTYLEFDRLCDSGVEVWSRDQLADELGKQGTWRGYLPRKLASFDPNLHDLMNLCVSVKSKIFRRSRLPTPILARLAIDEDMEVRLSVAVHRSATAEVLALLVGDEEREVRCRVASNEFTPPEILVQLGCDADPLVRTFVAMHVSTPQETLLQLALDPEWEVRRCVLENKMAGEVSRAAAALMTGS